MQDLTTAYYEVLFRLKYVESTGETFQDFFSTLMELRHPGDFVRVRPWGNVGDQKNDGYLKSQRKLFQCFAPDEMKPIGKWISKVNDDFDGALPYWKEYFDEWIFTHNSKKGLPPQVLTLLLELGAKHSPLNLLQWGYAELLAEFKSLSLDDVRTLLGPAPTVQDVIDVRVQDVMSLLDHIVLQPEPLTTDVRPVPAAKLQHNQLSSAVAVLLKAGMSRADIVKKYLRGLADQTRYDRVAAAFRKRYQELRGEGRAPDDIFAKLQEFILGSGTASPAKQAAVLAILAFFFEACEIFERPPTGATNAGAKA